VSPVRPDPVAAEIAAMAAACRDLGEVAAGVLGCQACPELVASRTSPVPGDFPASSRFLVVGEAPGAQEDVAGRPFVGKAGALLDELLAGAGIERSTVAVANVCNCRPPSNRTPSTLEARRCAGWLDRQVELVDPPLVVALGRTAVTWALGSSVKLADVRGVPHVWRGRQLIASYHPSAAIRFGPRGAPRAALAADLRLAAALTSDIAPRQREG
jgi:uracil-DNA glycosylase family 4